jgi:HAD superfamily hydrolase (TIGR01509 family)
MDPAALSANILFDFDGTLVDSGPLHNFAFRKVLESYFPQLLADFDYEVVRGKSTREVFLGLGIHKEDDLNVLALAKQHIYRTALIEGRLKLLPGAYPLLVTLVEAGHTLFLVTSGSRASIRMALDCMKIDHFFTGIVTAADVHTGKPSPDPFLYCMQRYCLAAYSCIVVEDAMSGVIAARKANLAVIGVHDHRIAGQVDVFFSSLWDLKQWFECMASGTVVVP